MGIWQRYDGVSVENGSSSVTVTVATLEVYTRPGDGASFDGGTKWYEVDAASDNQHFSIIGSFNEATIANGSVIIDNRSYRHQIESDILETLRKTLAGQTEVIETSGPPDANIGADKSLAFDPDARCYYHKVSGVWSDAIQLGGADGVDAGFQFSFDATLGMADPGAGKLRFNNATFGSINAIAIDDQSNDIGNPDISAYIVSQFAASTSAIKGTLIIRKIGSSAFRVFSITGLTDNDGWTQLAVLPVASSGAFATNDQVAVSFIRNGDKGDAGTAGVNAGFTMALDRSTVVMGDPGTAKVRFDNAAFNATNNIAIDDQSAETGNPSVAASIARWAVSTNAVKGKLHIRKVGQAQNFAIFDIMSVTPQTGWTEIGVAFEAAGGTLMTNDVCAFVFVPAGDEGTDGNDGVDGISAGFAFTFDTTTAMADPGAGKIRLDNATLSSVANIAIDDQSAASGNPDVSASILSWDGSTNANMRGTLRIVKRGHEEVYAEFAINGGTVDNVGWSQIAVSLISSAGAFANGDAVYVSATRAGDKGLDGDGAGDVVGPAGVADGRLAAFDTSTGKLLKDSGVSVSSDGTFGANSDDLIPTQRAIKTYIGSAVGEFAAVQSNIDCSGNPNYPAANARDVYRITAAGRIGGASGPKVEIGDRLECFIDGSTEDNHATVGGNWIISQANIDGPVTGPSASVAGNIPSFSGTTGKVLQDSGVSANLVSRSLNGNKLDPYTGQVATRCRINTSFYNGNKQMMAVSRHFCRDSISSLQLVFANWYVDNNGVEQTPGAPATITASIEYPAGVLTQVKFSGSASGTIADGSNLVSDAVSVKIPKGAEFWVRSYYTNTAGVIFNTLRDSFGGEASNTAASGITDQTMSGTVTSSVPTATANYCPVAIIGTTTVPSVILIGDSRVEHGTDIMNAAGYIGNLERSIAPLCATINCGKGGEGPGTVKTNMTRRAALGNAYCKYAIIQEGINDINLLSIAGATVAASIATMVGQFTIPTYTATIEPVSTSTDNWATVANQTTMANEAQRVIFNNAIRAGISGAAGYFEIADFFEPSRNSGKWKADGTPYGYTGNGGHASRKGQCYLEDSGIVDPRIFFPNPAQIRLPATVEQVVRGDASDRQVSGQVAGCKPLFKVHKNGTDQTGITTGVSTQLTWSYVVLDQGGYFDLTNNAYVPPAGFYRLVASITFGAGIVDQNVYDVLILKNGGTVGFARSPSSGTNGFSIMAEALVQTNGADVFTVNVIGRGTGDKTVAGLGTSTTFYGNAI